MEIKITCRSKQRKEALEILVPFYAKKLNLTKSTWKLHIHVLTDLAVDNGCNGCVGLYGEKELYMFLDSRLDSWTTMTTLAHEMVHVKQYVRGQLKYVKTRSNRGYYLWMGKRHTRRGAAKYYEAPWELEAFSKERILANRVLQKFPTSSYALPKNKVKLDK
jgi:hypothetical protein